jgi:predicted NACHT family NTPase
MIKEDVYAYLDKELAFLESLAFKGMESESIILSPKLLKVALKESQCSLQHRSYLLNLGILKSLDDKPIGTHIEAEKNHYFIHLSFQEYFAARYLVKALTDSTDQKDFGLGFVPPYFVWKRLVEVYM